MDLFLCLQFPRSDAKSHSQTHIESHLNLALLGLEATQHQVHELVTVVKEQLQQIERQSVQIERLMSKDKEQSEKMERSISTVQDQPPQREQRGPIKQIVPTPFIWKVHNMIDFYTRAAAALQNLVSEPFYLFERGYKYLLLIKTTVIGWSIDRHVDR